jgi:microcystin-dependent protein
MAQPYVGEIRMFAGNFAPYGWMFCEGQIISIAEYETLFTLIGTTYGGDGQETFALPDLRGRIPIHQGNFVIGETGGVEEVTLTTQQIPAHSHPFLASQNNGGVSTPNNTTFGRNTSADFYNPDANIGLVQINPNSIGAVGGSQPHNNFQPYLCVDFIISLYGIFPSPS